MRTYRPTDIYMPTSMKDSFLEQFQRNFGVLSQGLLDRASACPMLLPLTWNLYGDSLSSHRANLHTICGLDTRLLAGRVHTFWLLEGSLLLIVACIYLPTPASLLEVVRLSLSLEDLEQC
ncbi:Phosphoribosylaminoimidazole-succinocarboxamide synthase [Frankliniella fusca]|uniref:Phosphoribosylaminoimidazole-succinocarboxamide synthase n=1 Tax=Frankliniella fusca TaxID=407009 RepID=A0AAE1LR99_9NEOP|nr:Phosphoribosylaminoimidazole-succinocarboxamide synthase [Frankliniella fusca]